MKVLGKTKINLRTAAKENTDRIGECLRFRRAHTLCLFQKYPRGPYST